MIVVDDNDRGECVISGLQYIIVIDGDDCL